VDTDTVDRQFSALQQQAQQTASLIAALAGKLSTAATAGDPNAREWGLDLKAIHALIDSHVTAASSQSPAVATQPAAYYPPPTYQPLQYQPSYQQPAQGGGTLQRFLGGRFGQAIVTGAGIGIGDDIVNSVFDRL
jgi:hypothetical protein